MSKLITEPEKIRLQEESDVQAILGRPPGWLTQWGITFVLVGVSLLILMGSLLRYPDIVEAPALILGETPPIRIIAKSNLRVDHIWVDDGEQVDSGQWLLSLQNPVDLRAVQHLQTELEQLIPAIEAKNIEAIQLPQGLQLAQLQPVYSLLSELMAAQQFQLAKDDVQRRIRIYENELEQIRQLNQVTDVVIDTLKQEVFIAKNNQDTYLKLFEKGAASQQEYEEAKNNYLRYQRELENMKAEYSRNQLEAQIRQNQIITLTQEQDNEIKQGWRSLEEAARQLQAALEEWEENYLIKAPASGRIVFSEIWSDFQSVTEGDIMMTIDPEAADQAISVRARLPVAKSGKVRKGQEVLLRLQAYPYKEFGVLEGEIAEVAPLPEPGATPFYRLQISLQADSLFTTSDQLIPFTQEMQATARIITEDRSFLGRVLDELTSILERN